MFWSEDAAGKHRIAFLMPGQLAKALLILDLTKHSRHQGHVRLSHMSKEWRTL